MNRAQTIAQFRLWNQVCRHCGWHMADGRLQCAPDGLASRFAKQVWDQAATLARTDLRAATVNDLRHALYFLACGQVSSARIRTNAQCTRVIGWMLLCLDDASLIGARKAVVADGQETAETTAARVRSIRARGFTEEYIDKICRARFAGTYRPPFWEDLPAKDLLALYVLLKGRRAGNTKALLQSPDGNSGAQTT